jgi:Fe-Mn family superoxide dismutase
VAFVLPALPYSKTALVPHISEETLEYHHGKHHQAYVTNLNSLIEGSPLSQKSLDEIVKNEKGAIFNNVWRQKRVVNLLAKY